MRDPLIRLLPWLRPERRPLAWTVVVDLACQVALVAQSATLAWAVTRGLVDHRPPPVWLWWGGAAVVVARMLLTWHSMDLSHDVAYRVLAHLRSGLFAGFARGVPRRARGQHTGSLASTALRDVEELEFFYAHTVPQLVSAGVLLVAGTVVLGVVALPLALLLPLAAVLLTVAGLRAARTGRRLGEQRVTAAEHLAERAADVVAATREVVVFDLAEPMSRQLADAGRELDAAAARVELDQRRQETTRQAVVLAVVLATLVLSARTGVAGATATAVTVGTLALLAPIEAAAATCAKLHPLRAAAERVATGIELPAEGLSEPSCPRTLGDGPWGLSWGPLRLDLPGASVHLPAATISPGEHVALVGPSGAGKSTLVTCLAGLWIPDAGRIDVTDGVDTVGLGEVASALRCARIGVVDQDATVLRGTLRANLVLGMTEDDGPAPVSDDVLRRAVDDAGLSLDETRFADGLDTLIGEGGASISGGQRARLALARALVREPSVLVLDETTSSLDTVTEADLLRRLRALRDRVTVLLVSHRPSSIEAMERVIEVGSGSAQA